MKRSISATFLVSLVICILAPIQSLQAQVSTFDNDDEGWTVSGDATSATPAFISTGGLCCGFIQVTDAATEGVWYWEAPDEFKFDKSAYYTGRLKFNIRHSGSGPIFTRPCDLWVEGAGIVLCKQIWSPTVPENVWLFQNIVLQASEWVKQGSSDNPTEAEMISVLGNISKFRLRGEFIRGPDTGGLDNVTLELPPLADLSIAITESDDPVSPGQPLSYIITVTNNESFITAKFVKVVTVIVPSLNELGQVVAESNSLPGPGPGLNVNQICPCQLGEIEPGGSKQVTVGGTVGVSHGSVMITASVTSVNPDPNQENNTATEVTAVGPKSRFRWWRNPFVGAGAVFLLVVGFLFLIRRRARVR